MNKGRARKLEVVLLAIGLALLAIFAAFRIHSVLASRAALQAFAENSGQSDTGTQPKLEGVDASLWSEERVKAYKESLEPVDGPIAVLNIPRISLKVPVFNGTDEIVLNRGLGWIEGTARPGEDGNIGIAGHRDGFFRVLKDIQPGDRIELATLKGTRSYVVDKTEIVLPEDVSVLEPREQPALTLVTCYPFYFVGHAPKRFIVHASLATQALSVSDQNNTRVRTTDKKEVVK